MARAGDMVAALVTKVPVTGREPRDAEDKEFVPVPPVLRDLAEEWGGVTLGDGFYRFHTPISGSRATALCVPLVPDNARHWAFAFDWNGSEICLDLETGEIVVVDPGQGTWFNGEAELGNWHEIVAEEPQLLRFDLFRRWLLVHPEVSSLRFDQTIGFAQPLFLGGHADIDDLELWSHDVYLALFAQLFAKTEGLPPGTVVTASILDEVRRELGL
jgi:hypothetical protein